MSSTGPWSSYVPRPPCTADDSRPSGLPAELYGEILGAIGTAQRTNGCSCCHNRLPSTARNKAVRNKAQRIQALGLVKTSRHRVGAAPACATGRSASRRHEPSFACLRRRRSCWSRPAYALLTPLGILSGSGILATVLCQPPDLDTRSGSSLVPGSSDRRLALGPQAL